MVRENYKVSININLDVDLRDMSLAAANERKERLSRIISNCISDKSEFDSAKKRIHVSMKSEDKEKS